jgi:predicted AlkP superfamily pyrophosphatase or phosphodiesterase
VTLTLKYSVLHSKLIELLLLLFPLILLSCGENPKESIKKSSDRPKIEQLAEPEIKLVLFIIIDQFPASYAERFKTAFSGGIKTLLEQGLSFTNASHLHAHTETCPGHASIVTGVHPSKSGIVGNSWYRKSSRKSTYCVEDDKFFKSPRSLKVGSLPDWIKKKYPKSKAYSVSGKDRASIVMGGHSADGVYWYDKDTGRFETSRYYSRRDLTRMKSFKGAKKFFGTLWEPSIEDESLLAKMGIVYPDEGAFSFRLPQAIGPSIPSPNRTYFKDLYKTPWLDIITLDFAESLLREERLGQGSGVDYLSISLSALDVVGHEFGANSPQIFDVLMRLDRRLQSLLTTLDSEVGLDNVLTVFTSDHGIQAIPEYLGNGGKREQAIEASCIQGLNKKLIERFGIDSLLFGDFYINHSKLSSAGISRKVFDTFVIESLSKCPSVSHVWTQSELSGSFPKRKESFLELYANSFHLGRSADYFVQYREDLVRSRYRTSEHGSPYPRDRDVPLVFFGAGIEAQNKTERVFTVDIAPSIAHALKLSIPDALDGKVLDIIKE